MQVNVEKSDMSLDTGNNGREFRRTSTWHNRVQYSSNRSTDDPIDQTKGFVVAFSNAFQRPLKFGADGGMNFQLIPYFTAIENMDVYLTWKASEILF